MITLAELNREADASQPNHRLASKPIDFCILAIDEGENRFGAFYTLTIRAADRQEAEQLYLSKTAKRERRFGLYRQHLPLHGIRLTRSGPGRGFYDLVDGKRCACGGADASSRPAPAEIGQTQPTADASPDASLADEQQLERIRKLCAVLGREEPAAETLTYADAVALIRQMSKDFNASARQRKAS